MIENKYDDETFFAKYSAFPRSVHGLKAAGEWHELKKLLPDFAEKRVLDLGCGFGWHCFYAAEHGAKQDLGIDVSEKMLKTAAGKNRFGNVKFRRTAIEDIDFAENSLMSSSVPWRCITWKISPPYAGKLRKSCPPAAVLCFPSNIPFLRLRENRTGVMTKRETKNTGRSTIIFLREKGRPFSSEKK